MTNGELTGTFQILEEQSLIAFVDELHQMGSWKKKKAELKNDF